MRFDVVSIFPAMLEGPLASGVLGKARGRGLIEVRVHDLRDFADPPRRSVDDQPYGGGAGMVFRIEPLARAIRAMRLPGLRAAVVLPGPAGEVLTQGLVRELAGYEQLLILCDRYEGSDARLQELVTHEVSIGDFVITGGELAALVLVDAVARVLPGVVGEAASVERDSFSSGLLDHRCFTRPPEYRGLSAPETMTSGDHGRIERFRLRDALRRTLERRPDLLDGAPLGPAELAALDELRGSSMTEKG